MKSRRNVRPAAIPRGVDFSHLIRFTMSSNTGRVVIIPAPEADGNHPLELHIPVNTSCRNGCQYDENQENRKVAWHLGTSWPMNTRGPLLPVAHYGSFLVDAGNWY
jgi:hypothetical protein